MYGRRFPPALGACIVVVLAGAAVAALLLAEPAEPPASAAVSATGPAIGFVYTIGAAVFVLSLLMLWLVRSRRAGNPGWRSGWRSGWSLADAMSEAVDLTNDQGVPIRVMRASASRLIAFAGLAAMLSMYVGFGMFVLYDLGVGRKVPAALMDSLQKFMLAGAAMFAPYSFDQVRAAVNMARRAAAPAPTSSPPPSITPAAAVATAAPAPAAAPPVKALAGPPSLPALPPPSALSSGSVPKD